MAYNWQLSGWSDFTYRADAIREIVLEFALETGEINGILQSSTEVLQEETLLQLMLAEAIKTYEIEGEYLSREDVLSSIRNNMGLGNTFEPVKDRRAVGIGKLMVDVRQSYKEPLTEEKLKYWHSLLFSDSKKVNAGGWRKGTEPMQVVSGSYGKETIHFEAPPSAAVPQEMKRFIDWFNRIETTKDNNRISNALIYSALAHLYFESIHPFEDGNGRIGRAIAEKALARLLNRPVMISLSHTIEKNKSDYYNALKAAQRTLEVTDWIVYFASVILAAQKEAKEILLFTLKKTTFFDRYKNLLNERQLKVVRKMLETGVAGFEGGMSAKKYSAITNASKATATRDLHLLYEMGVFSRLGSGRSVRYELNVG